MYGTPLLLPNENPTLSLTGGAGRLRAIINQGCMKYGQGTRSGLNIT